MHGGIGGFDTDPAALWPLGDSVGMAALGLLEVSLRGLGLRWRVLGVEDLEVLAATAGREPAPAAAARPPIRVDCGELCRGMRESAAADWPGLVEEFVRELLSLDAEPDEEPSGDRESGRDQDRGRTQSRDRERDPDRSQPSGAQAADGSWSRVEGLLRSRIVPASVLPALLLPDQGPEAVVCQPVTEDLVEVVEVRSPDSLRLVRAGELAGWAVSGPAAVLRARENVRTDGALGRRRFTAEGASLIELSGDGHYVPTHLHWLRHYLAGEPGWSERNGALVALPHRRLLAAHVIESDAVEQAAGALARFAYRQFETCPGPVSDQVYWWCEDRLTRLPSDSVGETLQIFPTEAFAILLTRLRAES
ncbi:MAG TPA: hypothetical protein VGX23_15525 [Actinocrinis sp.]|nr:hypothetical protein [Actinocrinis sp.]